MTTNTRPPSHVGEFFKYTVLDERGISIKEAAEDMGLTSTFLTFFVECKVGCSHETAKRLAKYTGTSVDVWNNMQDKWDTWMRDNRDV